VQCAPRAAQTHHDHGPARRGAWDRPGWGAWDPAGLGRPGNLSTHLRKLEDAGYVTTHKNGSGVTARTSVALTHSGRAALEHYTTVLRQLLDSAEKP